jgi:hypothetical protein
MQTTPARQTEQDPSMQETESGAITDTATGRRDHHGGYLSGGGSGTMTGCHPVAAPTACFCWIF